LAVLTLLVWDPWLARSAGFSLSTLATLGLLLFAGPWGAAIGRLLPARIRSWGPALAVPVAAQLMCAPVIVLLQSSVSVVGVVANLFAAPFVGPATVLGVATALVSVVSTTVAGWIGWLAAGADPRHRPDRAHRRWSARGSRAVARNGGGCCDAGPPRTGPRRDRTVARAARRVADRCCPWAPLYSASVPLRPRSL
jgi:predicted membrane metal-binding protein